MEEVSNNSVVDLSVGDRKRESSDGDSDHSWRIKEAKEEKLLTDSENIGFWLQKLKRFEFDKRIITKFEVQVVRSWMGILPCGIGRRVG